MKWIYAPGCCSRAVPGALLWGKRVRILPKGGNLLCFPLLWCNKEHCCIWQFCKINYCSVCFFFPLFFSLSDSGRALQWAVYGVSCAGRHPQMYPQTCFWVGQVWKRSKSGTLDHAEPLHQWLPQQWGWQPPAPLALVDAAPEPGWVGTSSPATGQVGGCFWGLHHMPGGVEAPATHSPGRTGSTGCHKNKS